MNKFILNISLFAILLFLLIKGLGLLDNMESNGPQNHNITRILNAAHYDSLDILFIGNSYCYSGINPAIFNSVSLATYNLGIASAGPYFYKLVLDDYYKICKQTPKNILILIDPIIFSAKSDNWKSYPIHHYLNFPISTEEIVLRFGIYDQYFPQIINRAYNGLNKSFSYLLNSKSTLDEIDDIQYRGYLGSDAVFTDELFLKSRYLYASFNRSSFSWHKFLVLQELAVSYMKQGTNVIFFEVPTFKQRGFLSKEFIEAYSHALERLLNQNFIVIKNENGLDSTLFRNIDHLNSKGANLVSEDLLEILNNKSMLKLSTNNDKD